MRSENFHICVIAAHTWAFSCSFQQNDLLIFIQLSKWIFFTFRLCVHTKLNHLQATSADTLDSDLYRGIFQAERERNSSCVKHNKWASIGMFITHTQMTSSAADSLSWRHSPTIASFSSTPSKMKSSIAWKKAASRLGNIYINLKQVVFPSKRTKHFII